MSNCSLPKISVRKAKHDDYDKVLEIGQVYDGCDYIPDYYHSMIDDPDFHLYVVEVDGNLAGFEAAMLLDDGKSLQNRAARVKDGYKGMGLLKAMRHQIHEDFKHISTLKTVRTSCTNIVRLVDSKTFRQENKTLLKRSMMTFEHTYSGIQLDKSDNVKGAMEISLNQFSHLLRIDHLKNFLYPDGIITLISWFFDAIEGNIRFIEKLSPHIVVTESFYPYLKVDDNKQSELTESDICSGFVAISSHYFCPVGIMYHIDIFGTLSVSNEEREIEALFHNFFLHLKRVIEDQTASKSVTFVVNMPEGINKEQVKQAGLTKGFKLSDLDSKYQTQYYFEQDFCKLTD